MGVCGWFKMILGRKRKKENKIKKLERHADSKNSDGSKGNKYSSGNEPSFRAFSRRVIGRSTGTKEFAATRIQTAFRAYKARKKVRCMKGTMRFQALIHADALEKQNFTALDTIHFWSKIQGEIRSRRICMVTEGRIKQKKLENQSKTDSKLHELEVEWCNGPETMEKIVSRIQQREEATNKRERALAYAFSHQWRANSNRYFGQAYFDLSKESWGWSWMERWIAVCPWEARVVARHVGFGRSGKQHKQAKTTKNEPKILITVKTHPGINGRVQQKQPTVLPQQKQIPV